MKNTFSCCLNKVILMVTEIIRLNKRDNLTIAQQTI